jgi:hypothetical protein
MATRIHSNLRDPDLDIARLTDPEYFEARRVHYAKHAVGDAYAAWYVNLHSHTCRACGRIITHTGLEATREGIAAHQCCGADVRVSA